MFGLNGQSILQNLEDEYYETDKYPGQIPRWCSDCGDHAILAAIKKLCQNEQLAPEKTVFVSGTGCSDRFPDYMGTYGFNSLHGRALPVAEGVKIRRPDLSVFVNMGDGDCCSIGAAHWIHAIRYNMDMVAILHDNCIYGSTKAQTSPTSPLDLKSNTNPHGVVLRPLNPLITALSTANVSFVAQAVDWIPDLLYQILRAAFQHRGFSFVRILQRCPKYSSFISERDLADPGSVLLLTGQNELHVPESLTYKNQIKHDPLDLDRAREIASEQDLFPVGMLYRNEDIPGYHELQKPKQIHRPELVQHTLANEFDKFVKPSKTKETGQDEITVNGNTAIAQGILASGLEVCAMYPIDPAMAAISYLCQVFGSVGGLVHQAEDPISALGFALGASYAGKCAVTITSGPGLALMAEMLGFASTAEIPIVIVDVQRSGPSSGIPGKAGQGDLLSSIFGTPGDAPKVVIAPTSVEDCFYTMIAARKLAETFRMPVIVLSDADLAKQKQTFSKPIFSKEWLAPPIDQSPVPAGLMPYDWNEKTGLSRRFIPGMPGGMFSLTGLAHGKDGKAAFDPIVNRDSCHYRSLKIAALKRALKTPRIFGEGQGDLLIIGWGSSKEMIEKAVTKVRKDGLKASALHLKHLHPFASGIKEIIKKFRKTITVEINYSDSLNDEPISPENRRYGDLARLLRAEFLLDVDCWSSSDSSIFKPKNIEKMIREEIKKLA